LIAFVIVAFFGVLALSALIAVRVTGRLSDAAGAEDVRVPALKQAIKTNPADPSLHNSLGFIYEQTGREKAALQEYERVLDGDANNVDALYRAGLMYLRTGDSERGEQSLASVLLRDPSHVLAATALAERALSAGDPERALAVVKVPLEAHPETAYLHYLKGRAHAELGDLAQAKRSLRHALELAPNDPEVLRSLKRAEAGE
jgi:Flp pilus assembly protein TadD